MDPTVLVSDDVIGSNPKFKDYKENDEARAGLASALKTENLLEGMASRMKERYYFELNKHLFFNTGDTQM